MEWPWGWLSARGVEYRSQISACDLEYARWASYLFQASTLVPAIMYHCLNATDSPPKFPATISWTIRRGSPKHVQHTIWLTGWACLLTALDGIGRILGVQMLLAGIAAIFMAPVGVSRKHDLVHYTGTFLYMIDHGLFIEYVGVPAFYARGFYGSLVLFFVATTGLSRCKAHHPRLVLAPDSSAADIRRKKKALPKARQGDIWRWEFAEMFFEYAMFLFFLSGMCEGLAI